MPTYQWLGGPDDGKVVTTPESVSVAEVRVPQYNLSTYIKENENRIPEFKVTRYPIKGRYILYYEGKEV